MDEEVTPGFCFVFSENDPICFATKRCASYWSIFGTSGNVAELCEMHRHWNKQHWDNLRQFVADKPQYHNRLLALIIQDEMTPVMQSSLRGAGGRTVADVLHQSLIQLSSKRVAADAASNVASSPVVRPQSIVSPVPVTPRAPDVSLPVAPQVVTPSPAAPYAPPPSSAPPAPPTPPPAVTPSLRVAVNSSTPNIAAADDVVPRGPMPDAARLETPARKRTREASGDGNTSDGNQALHDYFTTVLQPQTEFRGSQDPKWGSDILCLISKTWKKLDKKVRQKMLKQAETTQIEFRSKHESLSEYVLARELAK